MWTKLIISIYLLVSIFCSNCSSFVLKAGKCPRIKPKPNFDINKFLGQWYVIYRDRSEADCIQQNITTIGPNKYQLTEIREPLAHGVYTTNKYEIQSNDRLKSELFLGRAFGPRQSVLVLMTDYRHYAVTYSCERRTFGHRQKLSIMSRSRQLSDLYLNKIYGYINRLGLTRTQLQAINQEECQDPELNENGFALNKPWYYFLDKYSNRDNTEQIDSADDKYW